jgi:hypothetical protein
MIDSSGSGGPGTAEQSACPEPFALLGEAGALLGKLAAADLTTLSGPELLQVLRELDQFTHRAAGVQHVAVAELDARHLAVDAGRHSTAALLADLLRLDPGEARRRVRDATDFAPRRGLTGEPLPPLLPDTAQALADGQICIEHARAISDLFDRIPAQDAASQEVIEAAALNAAAVCNPHRLRQWCVQAAARLDPNGTEPADRAHRERSLALIDRPDGTAKLTGLLTAHAASALRAVLGPLSAPVPAEGDTRDERTATQRRHDGLADACMRLLRAGILPDSGGAATTILATVDYRDLLHRYWTATGQPVTNSGYATTSYGTLLAVDELLRRAGDAAIIPVVLTDTGGVMAYGRTRRLASPAQRRALTARDQGCVRPGCTIPADWCEVHHLTPWQHHGPTNIDNLALICPQHHQQLDHDATLTMINGVPHWTEPAYLDPQQTPRRNTAHHMPRFPAIERAPDP